MTKRICFFIGSVSGKGGTERVCLEVANNLVSSGYEVSIVSLYEGENPFFELNSQIKLYQLYSQNTSFTSKYFQAINKLKHHLKNNTYDVFVSVETILCMYSVPALIFNKIPHIAWEHFNYEVTFGLRVRKWARFLAAKFAQKIVVLTTRDMDLWDSALHCKSKLVCITNPLVFKLNDQLIPYSQREKKVIAVGRYTHQKGFDLLVHAWGLIAHQFSDWTLQIIGSGEDESKLSQLATGISNIELIAANKNIQTYYNKASLFCLSSRFEGLPMVLIEAQAFGLPIVSFDCNTGPAEVVQPNYTGVLCEPENIEQLAESLASCMLDDSKRAIYSKNAIQAAERFNTEAITKKWINLFQNL